MILLLSACSAPSVESVEVPSPQPVAVTSMPVPTTKPVPTIDTQAGLDTVPIDTGWACSIAAPPVLKIWAWADGKTLHRDGVWQELGYFEGPGEACDWLCPRPWLDTRIIDTATLEEVSIPFVIDPSITYQVQARMRDLGQLSGFPTICTLLASGGPFPMTLHPY